MAGIKEKQHLFFDLDDTLWDFEQNSSRVLAELFIEFNLTNKLRTDFEAFSAVYQVINQQLWAGYYKKEIDKAYLRNHRFNLVFKEFSYDNYEENLLITHQYLLRAPQGKVLKANCLQVLDDLKQRFSLHIITNGFKETQYIKLHNCGLSSYFSTVIVSEEHGLVKPQKEVFHLAESLADAQRHQCVMIGDNLECDVHGALQAGWEAVHFSAVRPAGYEGHHITSLPQLTGLLGD